MTLLAATLHWFPQLPFGALVVVGGLLLALLAHGSWTLVRKQASRRWVATLAVLRLAAIVLFLLCLLQPTVTYVEQVAQQPELLVLVDTSQSMSLPSASDESSRLSATLAELQRSELLATLDRRYRTRWFAFDREARAIAPSMLESLTPRGTTTQFARGLSSALELRDAEVADAEGRSSGVVSGDASSDSPGALPADGTGRVRRVLLISDGHDQGEDDLSEAALRLGLSVDTLAVDGRSAKTPSSAWISRVQASRRVLLGSETRFQVTIDPGGGNETARGGEPARDVERRLTLFEDGVPVLAQDLRLEAGGGERHLALAYRPASVGVKRYELTLAPIDDARDGKNDAPRGNALPGADRQADGPPAYAVNVQVVDQKIEVLALEDRWRWEFKFLRRVVEDDPSFNLTAMLSRGGGAFVHFGEPERHVNLGAFPQSRTELDWFDILVLGDVHPSRWPKGLAGAVADAVIEGGKSLIVVAGPSLHELAASPELHSLLPVELSVESASPLEGPLALHVTPEGLRSPLFVGSDGRSGLAELPPIENLYPALRKRPAAGVLVEAAEQANAAGRLIVVAEQPVGRGRVLFLATDSLWKWQTTSPVDEQGRTIYGRFWQQALRTLAPHRTAGGTIWLTGDRSRCEAGRRVALEARLSNVLAPEEVSLQGTLVLPDERRVPLAFAVDASDASVYRAEFDTTAVGPHRVSVTALAAGQAVAESSWTVEATPARTELESRGVDHGSLARIARRTGGRSISLSDRETWPTMDDGPRETVERRRTVNLWENFSLLIALSLTLGADWLLRTLRGLAP